MRGKGSAERTGGGVGDARSQLYGAALEITYVMYEQILTWCRYGVPVIPTPEMRKFEKACINFVRAKLGSRNRRDKWKARKRIGASAR